MAAVKASKTIRLRAEEKTSAVETKAEGKSNNDEMDSIQTRIKKSLMSLGLHSDEEVNKMNRDEIHVIEGKEKESIQSRIRDLTDEGMFDITKSKTRDTFAVTASEQARKKEQDKMASLAAKKGKKNFEVQPDHFGINKTVEKSMTGKNLNARVKGPTVINEQRLASISALEKKEEEPSSKIPFEMREVQIKREKEAKLKIEEKKRQEEEMRLAAFAAYREKEIENAKAHAEAKAKRDAEEQEKAASLFEAEMRSREAEERRIADLENAKAHAEAKAKRDAEEQDRAASLFEAEMRSREAEENRIELQNAREARKNAIQKNRAASLAAARARRKEEQSNTLKNKTEIDIPTISVNTNLDSSKSNADSLSAFPGAEIGIRKHDHDTRDRLKAKHEESAKMNSPGTESVNARMKSKNVHNFSRKINSLSTIRLADLGTTPSAEIVSTQSSLLHPKIVNNAPYGVAILSKWRQNHDGTISGSIYGAKAYKDGEKIRTSKIKTGSAEGALVETESGSRYYLETTQQAKQRDQNQILAKNTDMQNRKKGIEDSKGKRADNSSIKAKTFVTPGIKMSETIRNTKQIQKPSLAKPMIVSSAPRGIATLSKWQQNNDGTVSGMIYGSGKYKDGQQVTTSKIKTGSAEGALVETESGSRYYLETAHQAKQRAQKELDAKNAKMQRKRNQSKQRAQKELDAKNAEMQRKRKEAEDAKKKKVEDKWAAALALAKPNAQMNPFSTIGLGIFGSVPNVDSTQRAGSPQRTVQKDMDEKAAEMKRMNKKEAEDKWTAALASANSNAQAKNAIKNSNPLSTIGLGMFGTAPSAASVQSEVVSQNIVQNELDVKNAEMQRKRKEAQDAKKKEAEDKWAAALASANIIMQVKKAENALKKAKSVSSSSSEVVGSVPSAGAVECAGKSENLSLPKPIIVSSAPRGVATLSKWHHNKDGSLSGIIYGSSNYKDGQNITTSKLKTGSAEGAVIETESGSRYYLESSLQAKKRVDDLAIAQAAKALESKGVGIESAIKKNEDVELDIKSQRRAEALILEKNIEEKKMKQFAAKNKKKKFDDKYAAAYSAFADSKKRNLEQENVSMKNALKSIKGKKGTISLGNFFKHGNGIGIGTRKESDVGDGLSSNPASRLVANAPSGIPTISDW
eukprot:CAMPEP_0184872412 /NCGR_PEP_ID=MMETSP0580-20130426/41276_1 /TAXON_ID=1118495 /ORGANISM="Dactyliosolen fragilissimus" /LENGTH=1145 /DNA_ID=CAMNT_0027375209 /DNA_START=30 /DNA_END=3464 /DNA_ORIENTATION=-